MNQLTSLINQLKKQQEQLLPFVVYRKPQSLKIQAFLQQDDVLYTVDDFSESGFVMAPFCGTPVLIPTEKASLVLADCSVLNHGTTSEIDSLAQDETQVFHEQLVQKGIEAIHSNQFDKVVLSRSETLEIKHFDWAEVFLRMVDLYPTAFAYCFYHPKVGMWLGAFAEQLVHFSKGQLTTMSVAGTQLMQAQQQPFWGEKEKQEQQFVTDFILDGLKKYTTQLKHSAPYSIQAGKLWHLRTDIQAKAEENQLKNIINFLHPTPAVCGFPKDAARKFILENEGYYRGYYSGFLGELNCDDSTDLFVNLRCLQVVASLLNPLTKVILYVGGGITRDSQPQKEWLETVHKAQTMKMVL